MTAQPYFYLHDIVFLLLDNAFIDEKKKNFYFWDDFIDFSDEMEM